MGRYLGRDTLAVAKAIYPYVRQGVIQLSEPVLIAEPKPSRPLKPSDKPSHILCIDDSMAIQKTVEFILQNEGYQVTTIGNPLKALGQVFLLNPDMILCDVAMPKLDGYELCAMLRKSSQFRETPMIMLTGKDGFTDRIKARMAGANEFLSKPFAEKELLTIVESYVGPPPKRGGGE
jgi:twitching motility two-component system response regulator PilG